MRSTEPAQPLRAGRSALRVLAVAGSLLAGCGGPTGPSDAARPDASADAHGATPSRVSLHVSVDAETLEDDTSLDRLSLGVRDVRVPYDRGRLEVTVERSYELASSPVEIMLLEATPGVYAEVELGASSGAWGPSLVMELTEPEGRVRLVIEEPLELEGRCDAPLELAAGSSLALSARLDIAAVAQLLRERELPPPIDGVIVVDRTSAPSLVSAAREALRDLELSCDDDALDG